jgi:hypothetical protein
MKLIFSNDYRTNNKIEVMTMGGDANPRQIEVWGLSDSGKELSTLIKNIRPTINEAIKQTDLTRDIFNFWKTPSANIDACPESDAILKNNLLPKIIDDNFDSILTNNGLKSLEEARNKLIGIIDKLNFVVYYEHDGKIDDAKYKQANLDGFSGSELYNIYNSTIDFLDNTNTKLKEKLDSIPVQISFDTPDEDMLSIFSEPEVMKDFIFHMIRYKKDYIIDYYNSDKGQVTDTLLEEMQEAESYGQYVSDWFNLNNYIDDQILKSKTLSFGLTFPYRINTNPVSYPITSEDELIDDYEGKLLNKIFINKPYLNPNTLNYYKK